MPNDLFSLPEDSTFRRGAQHAAFWMMQRARQLANEGKSAQDIASHMSDLECVIGDWRNGNAPNSGGVTGNPWTWGQDQLTKYIAANRRNWYSDLSDESAESAEPEQ
jgi:hypothetical protein